MVLADSRALKAESRSRGVSSTVKLPVSKTGLGGSNPSAPASFGAGFRTTERTDGEVSDSISAEPGKLWRKDQSLAAADAQLLYRRAGGNEKGDDPRLERSPRHHWRGDYHRLHLRAVFLGSGQHNWARD